MNYPAQILGHWKCRFFGHAFGRYYLAEVWETVDEGIRQVDAPGPIPGAWRTCSWCEYTEKH